MLRVFRALQLKNNFFDRALARKIKETKQKQLHVCCACAVYVHVNQILSFDYPEIQRSQ